MNIRKFLLTLISCFVLFSGYAQVLKGIVLNEKKQPIQGALVTIENSDKAANTDAKGSFIISGLKAGTYKVTVAILGYLSDVRTITITNGDYNIEVTLKEDAKDLEGYVVVGYAEQKQ